MPTWTFGATKASAKRSSGDSFEPFAPRSSRKREMNSSPVWTATASTRSAPSSAESSSSHSRRLHRWGASGVGAPAGFARIRDGVLFAGTLFDRAGAARAFAAAADAARNGAFCDQWIPLSNK